MWKRLTKLLACPICGGELNLISIEESKADLPAEAYDRGERIGIDPGELGLYVETGLLLCPSCKLWFPVLYGLPALFPYRTSLFEEFRARFGRMMQNGATGFCAPEGSPKPGEEFVLRSFSREWLNYRYDGVLWGWSYEDREETLRVEIGPKVGEAWGSRFLDVGCGIGVTTEFAQKNYCAEAVGIDLSLSVLKAVRHYRHHPFLHFIQASLFSLPFKKEQFDLVYSHGVLHHTFSTEKAFRTIGLQCRPGGKTYIWVYGREGLKNSWDRKMGHVAERMLRPLLSRADSPWPEVVLPFLAFGYLFLDQILRIKNPDRQRYNFRRALHAARDRFTPIFARRHDYCEVEKWFSEAGYENIQKVDWRRLPSISKDLFRGAVAVRGRKKTVS